jgi:citrate lyase subunit beta/citryl-CoA lyase
MLAKAGGLGADEIVVDLEDAVAPAAKEQARELVADFLARENTPAAAVAVRVNVLAGPWGERDVTELARRVGHRIGSLVVPKVERPDQISEVEGLLDAQGERASRVRLQALVETAAGLLRIGEIGAGSDRLEALILGYADLAASLGRAPVVMPPESWLNAQETLLVAARAGGLQAIDGPYLEIRDDVGLRLRAQHARTLGFDGKWAVRPARVAIINETFTPVPDEIERAQAILDALEGAEGQGAVELDGENARRGEPQARAAGDRARPSSRGGRRDDMSRVEHAPELVGGPWFEDLERGQVFDDAPGLTVTAGHAAMHQALVGDRLRLALDAALCARSRATRTHSSIPTSSAMSRSGSPPGRLSECAATCSTAASCSRVRSSSARRCAPAPRWWGSSRTGVATAHPRRDSSRCGSGRPTSAASRSSTSGVAR